MMSSESDQNMLQSVADMIIYGDALPNFRIRFFVYFSFSSQLIHIRAHQFIFFINFIKSIKSMTFKTDGAVLKTNTLLLPLNDMQNWYE